MAKKEKITIKIKKEDLLYKPRAGVIYSKMVPDKTKYSRKNKHKKSKTED